MPPPPAGVCLTSPALLKHGVKTSLPGVAHGMAYDALATSPGDRDDPPLYPPGNGFDLGGADALQDLVRDRGACGGCVGRTRRDPEASGQGGLGQGTRCDLR